ncbi:murein hydrolase activator EnvC family protein [Lentibacillus cibarius]|uniref:Uncharacterized protein n=1 Tax=Lentibacillus cibarius TaxID=2583219 RepID=A0A5S3R751_9BACI|nr:peptidoglycan DD-metalloendopeptidase family protein [Lentibacillus cibarius]TMN21343.1 hypothetical protein FFL34_03895 [Lentibacillus cibarius]
MMRKWIAYLFAAFIVLGFGLTGWENVSAASASNVNQEINELKKKQDNLHDKKSNLKNKKENTEAKIAENKDKQVTVNSAINKIDQDLTETRNAIKSKENEIAETNRQLNTLKKQIDNINNKIDKLKKDIKKLKERIEKREELLKDRLRAIQSNGGSMKYIEVIMGSNSFSDFISRSSAVSTIMEQDKNIMETHAKEKKQLEDKQAEVEEKKKEIEDKKTKIENKKASLESKKQELESLQEQLDKQMNKKEEKLGELKKEQNQLENYKMSLAEQQQVVKNQEAAVNKAIRMAKQRKEELNQLGNEANGSGSFAWPASGYITDYYGSRGGTHPGIDLGNATAKGGGNVPIKAAADGVVTRAYTSSSYGNVVFITHVIDGDKYETVYAHMKYPPMVRDMQVVKKGQQIGVMGSTGDSTGPHLHFEVHQPKWTYSKQYSTNPLSYLP